MNSVFTNENCEDLCPWCWLCFPNQDVEQCENYCESECDYKYIEGPKHKRAPLDVCIDGDSNVGVNLAPLEDGVNNIVDGLIGGSLGAITDSLEDGVNNIVDGLVGGSLGAITDSLTDVGNILDVDKLVGDLTGGTGEPLVGLDKILDLSSSIIPEGLVDSIKNELLGKASVPVVGALSSISEDILKPPSADSVLETLTGGVPATSSLLDKVADEVAAALLDRVGDNPASGIFSNILPTVQNNILDSKANDETLLDIWASKLADGALDESRVSSSDVLQDAVKAAVVDKLTSDSLDPSDSNDILKQTLTSAISNDIASKILG